MGKSTIEWTDATWNPVRGCTRVSPGCFNCYAERTAMRFSGPGKPYEGLVQITNGHPQWTGKVAFVEEHLRDPLKWVKPQRVFVNSMSDLFHEGLPDEQIERVFAVMALARQHTFQILTKRPERMLRWFKENNGPMETCEQGVQRYSEFIGKIRWDARGDKAHLYSRATPESVANRRVWPGWPLPNVILGVSVESPKYKSRIDLLRETPAAVRMISLEPLLEDLGELNLSGIHWTIVGGESGPGARPMHPDWARSIRDQCLAAKVPFFFKQWGEWIPGDHHVGPPDWAQGAYQRVRINAERRQESRWPPTGQPGMEPIPRGQTMTREPITEEWLKIVGFKWHEVNPGQCKHWTLWMGAVSATDQETEKQDGFTGDEDLGIELSETTTSGQWHCWIRADYSGRYSRFVHIRHLKYQDEVKYIVAAMSGRFWNPANHLYGKIFTELQREAIRKRDERLDMKTVKSRPWDTDEKDETKATRGQP